MYGRILIATDGSALAGRAVTHAIGLAKETGGSVVVVTVTEMWSAVEMARSGGGDATHAIAHFEGVAAEHAAEVLAKATAEAAAAGVACEGLHVSDRRPSQGILEAAMNRGCDLIVMASHGRRGLNRLILGSQAAEVVTLSTIPVLVVK